MNFTQTNGAINDWWQQAIKEGRVEGDVCFSSVEAKEEYIRERELRKKARLRIIEAAAEGNERAWTAFALLDVSDAISTKELPDNPDLSDVGNVARNLADVSLSLDAIADAIKYRSGK